MKLDVIGFGALNFDHFYIVDSYAAADHQVTIKSSHGSPGGSSANAIYGLAHLGIRTGFVGAIGGDIEGNLIMSQMRGTGIDVTGINMFASESTSKIFVFVDRESERAMYSLPGASSIFRADEKDVKKLCESDYTLISAIPGIPQFQHMKDVVEKIHDAPRIVFMPGGLYIGFGLTALKDIIKSSYLFVVNRREISELTGKDELKGAKQLLKLGCKVVIVTMGKDGCLVCEQDSCSSVATPPIPKEKIVDTTGAGDAFTAGFIYGMINGKDMVRAAIYGNLLAGYCIQSLDARAGLPEKNKLEEDFKMNYKNLEIKEL